GVALGIPALVIGRRRGGALRTAGVFYCLVGLYGLAATFPYILELLGVVRPDSVVLDIPHAFTAGIEAFSLINQGVQAAVAVLTLLVVVVLAVRRRLGTSATLRVLGALFLLNVGLQVLVWLVQFYQSSGGARPIAIQAAVILGGFLWDLLTSGATTNHD